MMETVDATLTMLSKQTIETDEIENVVVRIPESGARTVNNRKMPDVNVQYMVASILIDGKLSSNRRMTIGAFKTRACSHSKKKCN